MVKTESFVQEPNRVDVLEETSGNITKIGPEIPRITLEALLSDEIPSSHLRRLWVDPPQCRIFRNAMIDLLNIYQARGLKDEIIDHFRTLTIKYAHRIQKRNNFVSNENTNNNYVIPNNQRKQKDGYAMLPLDVNPAGTMERYLGQTAHFKCSSKKGQEAVIWSKRNGSLPPQAQINGGNLVIPNLQQDDFGLYDCSMSDPKIMPLTIMLRQLSAGSQTSEYDSSQNEENHYQPKYFVQQPYSYPVQETIDQLQDSSRRPLTRDEAYLQGTIYDPNFQWPSQAIDPTKYIKPPGYPKSGYTYSHTPGQYSYPAKYQKFYPGKYIKSPPYLTTSPRTIPVTPRPIRPAKPRPIRPGHMDMVAKPPGAMATLGSEVEFICTCLVIPQNSYCYVTWTRPSNIKMSPNAEIIEGNLTIRNISNEDYGLYKCVSKNGKQTITVVLEKLPRKGAQVISGEGVPQLSGEILSTENTSPTKETTTLSKEVTTSSAEENQAISTALSTDASTINLEMATTIVTEIVTTEMNVTKVIISAEAITVAAETSTILITTTEASTTGGVATDETMGASEITPTTKMVTTGETTTILNVVVPVEDVSSGPEATSIITEIVTTEVSETNVTTPAVVVTTITEGEASPADAATAGESPTTFAIPAVASEITTSEGLVTTGETTTILNVVVPVEDLTSSGFEATTIITEIVATVALGTEVTTPAIVVTTITEGEASLSKAATVVGESSTTSATPTVSSEITTIEGLITTGETTTILNVIVPVENVTSRGLESTTIITEIVTTEVSGTEVTSPAVVVTTVTEGEASPAEAATVAGESSTISATPTVASVITTTEGLVTARETTTILNIVSPVEDVASPGLEATTIITEIVTTEVSGTEITTASIMATVTEGEASPAEVPTVAGNTSTTSATTVALEVTTTEQLLTTGETALVSSVVVPVEDAASPGLEATTIITEIVTSEVSGIEQLRLQRSLLLRD
ncbi:uncharacterized protein LOC135924310 [Gordionus sp. m RMFG-2023]|uniref:uncharacterized protein LOC135924310 n=1 Tax=Gordionus sp. m RMFG-2023 TaxID=3053472 RepID=UPI0031FDF2FC